MNEKRKPWFEGADTGKKLFAVLCVICAALLVADIFYEKHPHFAIEDWFGGYALLGAGFAVVLLGAVLGLRPLLRREEDYYDD